MPSKGINKVILVGNLGQNPEVRYMSNGNAVTNIFIATSETWRDKQTGDIKEKTEWHRIVIFGKIAEIAGEYLRKGSQVYIEGSLHTRKWKDQSGIERYITEIIVNMNGTLQILGNKNTINKNEGNIKITSQNNKNIDIEKNIHTQMIKKDNNSISSDFDDDIPF